MMVKLEKSVAAPGNLANLKWAAATLGLDVFIKTMKWGTTVSMDDAEWNMLRQFALEQAGKRTKAGAE
jgi:hypothetical protein